MASDMFIKLGDIKGESLDDQHTDEVEVMSWSWDGRGSQPVPGGSGGGTGKAGFNDLTFTHSVDKATPNLMKACATGEHIGDATLTVRKSGTDPQEYLLIKMEQVFVASVMPGGAGDGGLIEDVGLQFAKVELEYKPQKEDGSPDAGVIFKYDIKATKSE